MLYSALMTLFRGGSINAFDIIAYILSVLFIILLILPLHEFAHGFMAVKLGDSTPKYDKRLTLNPLASVEPLGALFLLLFGYGWAKPVQVNPRNFKNPKRDMAIVALAGPLSNLLAALVGALIFCAMVAFSAPQNGFTSFVNAFLSSYISVNVSLAVFNLIPLPPLDGSRIVAAFLSDRVAFNYYRYQNYIVMIFFLLMFTGVLSYPLGVARNFFTELILNIAQAPFALFGLL